MCVFIASSGLHSMYAFCRVNKTPGQTLIRYSVQMGYITIPKSQTPARIIENTQVFDWSIPEEEMAKLVRLIIHVL